MTTPTKAPRHLSAAGRKLYLSVTADYHLEPHHLAILTRALDAMDTADAAEAIVRAEGPVTTTRLGERKAHPAVGIARDARAQFGTLVKQLGLDIDGPPAPSTRNRTR